MYEIPIEKKYMQLIPKIKEPNQKPESSFRRSLSVDRARMPEAMNELEGIERQDVKINKYSRNDMKKQKLSNGRILQPEERKENAIIIGLEKRVLEQNITIKRLSENCKILEKQLLPSAELMQYCRKMVEEEWETHKNGLLDQVIREYLPKIEEGIQSGVLKAVMGRKEAIDECIIGFVKEKVKGDL